MFGAMGKTQALCDSGSQVPLIHPKIIGYDNAKCIGSVDIQPIVGPNVKAQLAADCLFGVLRHISTIWLLVPSTM
jgi:hypothetical protein